MKNFHRVFFLLSLLLIIASWATCHFGVEYEINKIPAEQRVQMTDFDWVGMEWVARGTLIFFAGLLIGIITLILWIIWRRRLTQRSFSEVKRD